MVDGHNPEELAAVRAETLKAGRSSNPIDALAQNATGASRDMDLLHFAAELGVLQEQTLHRLCNTYLGKRDYAPLVALIDDDSLGLKNVRDFHRSQLGFGRGGVHMPFAKAYDLYLECERNSIVRVPFQHLLLRKAAAEEEWGFIEDFLGIATDPELAFVPTSVLNDIITCLAVADGETIAKSSVERIYKSLTPFERVKLSLPLWKVGAIESMPTPRALFDDMIGACEHSQTQLEWMREKYFAALDSADKQYMGLRTEPDQLKQLRATFTQAVEDRRPFSFLRIGDGEAYRLPRPPIVADEVTVPVEADAERCELAWWKRNPPSQQTKAFAANTMAAFQSADVLGICSVYRMLHGIHVKVPLTGALAGRAWMSIVHAFDTVLPLDGKIVTEEFSNMLLFTAEYLSSLCEEADRVVYVGSADAKNMNLSTDTPIRVLTTIPALNRDVPTLPGARSIVDDNEGFARDVRAECGPGTLLLVAAGYAGKGLCQVGKEAGAVALDIGSAADRLAGHATRSPAARL